ncbi:MAG TPA: hypothetical protein VM901_07310 [Bdellovibrionota bacterium]|jgi:hypothetical protein|nr:hypothetical protein [Bdellovibrionota bacterium]
MRRTLRILLSLGALLALTLGICGYLVIRDPAGALLFKIRAQNHFGHRDPADEVLWFTWMELRELSSDFELITAQHPRLCPAPLVPGHCLENYIRERQFRSSRFGLAFVAAQGITQLGSASTWSAARVLNLVHQALPMADRYVVRQLEKRFGPMAPDEFRASYAALGSPWQTLTRKLRPFASQAPATSLSSPEP